MKRKPYRFLLYVGLYVVQGVTAWLPRSVALKIAQGVGRLAFLVARRERERTLQHLREAYGREMNEKEIEALGRKVFIHFAWVAVDQLRFPRLSRGQLESLVEGGEKLSIFDEALSEGKGVILLTGHLGNWELMGGYFRLRGYEGAAVVRRLYYEPFNRFLMKLRGEMTLRAIYQDDPPREFMKVLRQNEILGILADQDIDHLEGIFVPFFGRPAYTLTAPVKLALATGAPIVPAFLIRQGDRYEFLVEEPIRVEWRGSKEETIREYTARWSRVIEEKIRTYPEQWAWMHRRWKTQPREAEEMARCS